jgi:hypothetical protein
MKYMLIGRVFLFIGAAMVATPALAADDRVREAPGFHGNVLFGGGYLDLESNLVAGNKLIDANTKTISSVGQSPPSNDTVYPFVTGEVNYTFGDRWEVFFGGSIEDYLTLDLATRLGLRKQAEGVGVVGLSVLFSGVPAEVWEDPYLAGEPRRETDRDSAGFRFDWWRILDSGFFFQYATREVEVGRESSGTDPALGLTADEIALLRRDGDNSRMTLGYRWQSGRSLWQPEIAVGEDDRDGKAVSADFRSLKLTYSYLGETWTIVGTGLVFQKDHDRANPVYGRKIDEDGYALSLALFRRLDIGDGRWRAFGIFAYADSDSDVDFHDTTATAANLGVAYFFGN